MKRPPTIVVQLVHLAGPRRPEIQEFTKDVIRIGKYSSCEVRFSPDDRGMGTVSRVHAEIVRDGNRFKLIDRSTNGTFVNGKRVKETYLKEGDVLEFSEGGPKVSFVTHMREAAAEPVITSPPPHSNVEERLPPKHHEPPLRKTPQIPVPSDEAIQPPPVPVVEIVKAPLIIQYGPTIRSYKELPISIGKSPKCQFVLDHPAVYDQHAQIFFSRNQYWIKDLTGQQSVRINRQPMSFQAPLTMGDEVALSQRGPFFRYIGEGRFAEALELPPEEPSGSKNEAETGHSEDAPSKGIVPKIKKLFTT